MDERAPMVCTKHNTDKALEGKHFAKVIWIIKNISMTVMANCCRHSVIWSSSVKKKMLRITKFGSTAESIKV